MLSRLLAKMSRLKSIYFILIISSDQIGSDWDVMIRELYQLEYLGCIGFTIYCLFPWYEDLRGRFSKFIISYSHEYVPVVNFNSVRFDGVNLSKEIGLSDFKGVLSHTHNVYFSLV